MKAPAATALGAFMRGDGFQMLFTLQNDWLGALFDEMKFTVRRTLPPASTTTDTDALGQVTMTGGGITFDPGDDASGTAIILAAVTTTWPTGLVYWDLQGEVDGDPKSPYTIGRGTITVVQDVTRSVG